MSDGKPIHTLVYSGATYIMTGTVNQNGIFIDARHRETGTINRDLSIYIPKECIALIRELLPEYDKAEKEFIKSEIRRKENELATLKIQLKND